MVEINESDLAQRPANLPDKPEGKKSGGFNLEGIKDMLSQVKELKGIAEDLGLNIPSLIGGKNIMANDSPAQDKKSAPSFGTQLRAVLKMLEIKYKDPTVNELLVKLKEEYGDWHISSFTKGGIV